MVDRPETHTSTGRGIEGVEEEDLAIVQGEAKGTSRDCDAEAVSPLKPVRRPGD